MFATLLGMVMFLRLVQLLNVPQSIVVNSVLLGNSIVVIPVHPLKQYSPILVMLSESFIDFNEVHSAKVYLGNEVMFSDRVIDSREVQPSNNPAFP